MKRGSPPQSKPLRFASSAFKAFEHTRSLRTTVPSEVVAMLGLEDGFEIVWEVVPGSTSATVSKGGRSRVSTSRRASSK